MSPSLCPAKKMDIFRVNIKIPTWMSRWKLGSMVRISGLFHLPINGVCWGYNPLTNHLLTSWDIQVYLLSTIKGWNGPWFLTSNYPGSGGGQFQEDVAIHFLTDRECLGEEHVLPNFDLRQCPLFLVWRCDSLLLHVLFHLHLFKVILYGFYHGKSSCFTTIRGICLEIFPTTLSLKQANLSVFVSSSHDFRKSTRVHHFMSSCLRLGASRWRIFELLHHFTSLRWILVKQKRGENTLGGKFVESCWLSFKASFFKSRVGRALPVSCMDCIMVSVSKPWICLVGDVFLRIGIGDRTMGWKITIISPPFGRNLGKL